MGYIYIMEYHSAIEKNKKLPFAATWMDLEIFTLNEVSQTQKESIILLLCGIKKGVQMKIFTKQKSSHRCRKQIYAYQGIGKE